MGIEMGTGSAFSLLPTQNATGNWIKVVQRVPVRIQLDPQQLAENPLRIGLSATVKVNEAIAKAKPCVTKRHLQRFIPRMCCNMMIVRSII